MAAGRKGVHQGQKRRESHGEEDGECDDGPQFECEVKPDETGERQRDASGDEWATAAEAVGGSGHDRNGKYADQKRERRNQADLGGIKTPGFQPDRKERQLDSEEQEQRHEKEGDPCAETARPHGAHLNQSLTVFHNNQVRGAAPVAAVI